MKNMLESPRQEILEEEQQASTGQETLDSKKVKGITRNRVVIGSGIAIALCLILTVILFFDMFRVGAAAAGNAFTLAKDAEADQVRQAFYETSYDAAEKAHHVSNRVSISIGDLCETQKLEVLAVTEVSYQENTPEEKEGVQGVISDITGLFNKDLISWLEIPGSGVFTVNLQLGEFIIDNERQSVLIRIPGPELTNFTLDYEDVEILYFEAGGVFKNSVKFGAAKAREQLQDAQLEMQQSVSNNQVLYKRAEESAENMLIRLVKALNPQLPELTVQVEFLN